MAEKLEQHEIDKIIEKENRRKCIEELSIKWGWSKRKTKKLLRCLRSNEK